MHYFPKLCTVASWTSGAPKRLRKPRRSPLGLKKKTSKMFPIPGYGPGKFIDSSKVYHAIIQNRWKIQQGTKKVRYGNSCDRALYTTSWELCYQGSVGKQHGGFCLDPRFSNSLGFVWGRYQGRSTGGFCINLFLNNSPGIIEREYQGRNTGGFCLNPCFLDSLGIIGGRKEGQEDLASIPHFQIPLIFSTASSRKEQREDFASIPVS